MQYSTLRFTSYAVTSLFFFVYRNSILESSNVGKKHLGNNDLGRNQALENAFEKL